MNPNNVMKFLEDDDDETMHSEADVDAFAAELNRDIESNSESTFIKSPDSDVAALSKESSFQTLTRNNHVPFGELLPIILPYLDKDRAVQIGTLHEKLRKNEISRKDFSRHARSIVGDHVLNVALYKLKTQDLENSRKAADQSKSQTQFSSIEQGPNLIDQTRHGIGNSHDVENQSDSHGVQPYLTSPIGRPKVPPKKDLIGQKRQVEAPGSLPQSLKKRKAQGGFSNDQLNDVIAASGLNLDDEEELLFSGCKEVSRLSEVSRSVVQEEGKLFLQKIPLQKKVAEIMTKSGLKCMDDDVVRCLSLCVEERLRGLIADLIRLSNKRVDTEKPMHRTIVTSDIRQQILTMNRKVREELENKQAETDKLLEPTEGSRDKDDKTRATAANAVIRAATGGDDMVSRWQLMKPLPTSLTRKSKESHKAEKHDHSKSLASVRKVERDQVTVHRVARRITKKDVIAILERQPQMSKSILIYQLYNKISCTDASPTKD